MSIYYIYTLTNPLINELFYVGCTVNPKQRFWEHIANRNLKDTLKKREYFSELEANGIKPIMQIVDQIESTNHGYISKMEIAWIRIMQLRHGTLINTIDGKEIQDEQEAFEIIAHYKELNNKALQNVNRKIKLSY